MHVELNISHIVHIWDSLVFLTWLVFLSPSSKEYVIFTLKYPLPEGLVHEEYILYDEVAIVGSIGGTLGLFIGFSFRDIVVYILDKLRHYCINNPWH